MTPKDEKYNCNKDNKKEEESGGHAPTRKRKCNLYSCGQGRIHYSSKYEEYSRNSKNENATNDNTTDKSKSDIVTCTPATDK